jgi:hypothetical protein
MKRSALLIGNTTFESGETFANLLTPANDAEDFAAVLQQYGNFEVQDRLINAPADLMRQKIEYLFSEAEADDLILLYYSGHGYRSSDGRFYLVAADSQPERLLSTGISESFIREVMRASRAQQRVIIMDCCFSATLAEGRKSAALAEPLLLDELRIGATDILASSSALQHSFFEKGSRNSLFTQFLLDGIKTGQADKDDDGYIAIYELFNYAEKQVRTMRRDQRPLKAGDGKVCLTANPTKKTAQNYHHSQIRKLLTDGFSPSELKTFSYDNDDFRPVYNKLTEESDKEKIIKELIDYADRKEQLDNLLAWTKETNPAKYNLYQPYSTLVLPLTLPGHHPTLQPDSKSFSGPFYRRPVFIISAIIIILLILGVGLFRPKISIETSTPSFSVTPTTIPPTPLPVAASPPVITLLRLERPFSSANTVAAEGDYIPVTGRPHIILTAQHVDGQTRHLWLYVCEHKSQGTCQIQELNLSSEKLDDFVNIGDSEAYCAYFEVGLAVVNQETHLVLQELLNQTQGTPIPRALLPAKSEAREWHKVRRSLFEAESVEEAPDSISCP